MCTTNGALPGKENKSRRQ